MNPAPCNLVLIGFMASGKSTIGRRCARALSFRFRDSDALIERRAGKPITRIFAEDGEPAFRAMEVEAIRELARWPRTVIATGGGAAVNPLNAARLRRSGVVVLLQVEPEEILRRTARRRTRPLLLDAEDPEARVRALLSARMPAYLSAAHVVVPTAGMDAEAAAQRVLDAYRVVAEARAVRTRRTGKAAPAAPEER